MTVGGVAANSVTRVDGTNTFEFTFTGLSAGPGNKLVFALAAGWEDSAGNLGTAATDLTLTMATGASVEILLPAAGACCGDIASPQRIVAFPCSAG